jgi:hypothetical protein
VTSVRPPPPTTSSRISPLRAAVAARTALGALGGLALPVWFLRLGRAL